MKPCREIAIYAEGGGDTAQQRADLRQGFDGLFKKQKSLALEKGIGWKLICCGGRELAYRSFLHATQTNAAAINILLVDSEGPMAALSGNKDTDASTVVRHLSLRDKWQLNGIKTERVHLMVQSMEAWIIADPTTLAAFYGQYFRENLLPKNVNLEDVAKSDVYDNLLDATSDYGKFKIPKGRYGKIKHASQLLKLIDPVKVAGRCPRFKLFCDWLDEAIGTV